jgi:hypothetical protein
MQQDCKQPASDDVKGILGTNIDNNCQHKRSALNADLLGQGTEQTISGRTRTSL